MVSVDLTLLGITLILGIISVILGLKWVGSRSTDPKIVKKRVDYYVDYIEELEDEIKSLKGAIAQTRRVPQITGDFDLESDEGIKQVLHTLLPSITPMLPKALQGLANDPNAINFAVELYKKNPERAKQLISQFIKKGKKSESTTTDGIPDFNPAQTV